MGEVHEATKASACSDSTVGVDVVNVLLDVFKHFYDVGVWGSAPVILDLMHMLVRALVVREYSRTIYLVNELLSVTTRSGKLDRCDNKTLVGPEAKVPACAPIISLSTLGSLQTVSAHKCQ